MKKTILFFILSVFANLLLAQNDQIVVNASEPEAEFNVAINPTDSNNIIIATIEGFANPNTNYITIMYTNDFGASWTESDFHGVPAGNEGAGDPVLSFDADGNAYVINLTLDADYNVSTILSKSIDGGATWESVTTVSNFSDKPWLALDRFEQSPHLNNIYIPVVEMTLNLHVLDTAYQTLSNMPIPNGEHLPSVVVKNDGEVFVSSVGISDPNEIYIQQYTSGGTELVHSTFVVSFPDYTFNAPDVSERFQPSAYIAVDNSEGAFAGRLYLSYTASETGNSTYFDVFLMYSDDNGLSWSTPQVVHSDVTTDEQQFYSSLYVNDQGVLILDWYDRRNFDNSNLSTDFYMGISYDGGESFTEVQLNSEPMDFQFMIPASNSFGIGEYHQCVATDNTAISFWSDGRTNDGDLNIYMAKVNIENPLVGVEELSVLSNKVKISNLFPQPVEASFTVAFTLAEKINLTCEILDLQGRSIWKGASVDYLTGEHHLTIPATMASGTYFLRVHSDKGYFKSMKFIKQ